MRTGDLKGALVRKEVEKARAVVGVRRVAWRMSAWAAERESMFAGGIEEEWRAIEAWEVVGGCEMLSAESRPRRGEVGRQRA